jgi:hypothetical protein
MSCPRSYVDTTVVLYRYIVLRHSFCMTYEYDTSSCEESWSASTPVLQRRILVLGYPDILSPV